MAENPQYEKWCSWLGIIRNDVQTLYFYRYIFNGLVEIVERNKELDLQSPFFSFSEHTYGDSLIMGIRRQIKKDVDSISLANLLTEIAENPELVTRSNFYKIYRGEGSPIIDQLKQNIFDRFTVLNAPCVDSEKIKADLDLLKVTCKPSEGYADRRIAHWDKRQPGFTITFDSMFRELNFIGEMLRKYYLLFFGADLTLLPHSDHPVFDIFQNPWID